MKCKLVEVRKGRYQVQNEYGDVYDKSGYLWSMFKYHGTTFWTRSGAERLYDKLTNYPKVIK